jgi:hypothetical protein
VRAQEVLYRERHRIAARAGAGPWRVRVAWRKRFARCGPGGGAGDWRRGAQARLDAALLLVTAAAFGS